MASLRLPLSICQSGKYNSLEQNARVSPANNTNTYHHRSLDRSHTKLTKFQFDNDPNAIPVAPDAPIDLYLDLYYNGMSLDQQTLPADGTGITSQRRGIRKWVTP